MDPIVTTGLVAGVGVAASKRFIDGLIGPSADAAGAWVRDRIALIMGRNVEAVADRARRMVEDSGTPTEEVPLKQLIPILQGAALEEDASLQDRWAALLANAATASGYSELSAVFAEILCRLRPIDAQILDILVDAGVQPTQRGGMLRGSLEEQLPEVHSDEIELSLSVLGREGLVEYQPKRIFAGSLSESDPEDAFRVTSVATRFVRACRPPVRRVADSGL
jgi:hypothetical protein